MKTKIGIQTQQTYGTVLLINGSDSYVPDLIKRPAKLIFYFSMKIDFISCSVLAYLHYNTFILTSTERV